MDKKYLIASVLSLVLLFGAGIAWASAESSNIKTRGGELNKSSLQEFRGSELGQGVRQKVASCNGNPESCSARALKRGIEFKAKVLGLSVEELQASLESGKTMIQIAEEKGIDLANLKPNFEGKNSGLKSRGGSGNCLANSEASN